MDLAHKIIIGFLVIITIILINIINTQENAGSVSGSQVLSTEAIANIAKVYADTTGIATFNNVNITGNLNPANFRGIIVAYNSQTAPAGWALCDGSTYTDTSGNQITTPDLRGRFIRMAYTMTGANGGDINGDNVPIKVYDTNAVELNKWMRGSAGTFGKMQQHKFGDYGGTDWRQLSIEEMPQHNHSYSAMRNDIGSEHHNGRLIGYSPANWWPLKANGSPTDNAGSSFGHGIMPPYYVLTYIMKL
jgi:microcystin-dependent protein